jgi:hypothetical protein
MIISIALITLGTLAIVTAGVSVFAYDRQCYRIAVATEVAAAALGFSCGVLLPFLMLTVTE